MIIKGSWEAIFRVTDVCCFRAHHDEKCETILNEWWCGSLHHITMRSVRLYSMNGGVRVDITSRWEVWDYTQWMVVWELTSHHDEKCETILNEWWCVSLHSGGDRCVMGAWLLSLCAATCVERCRFATLCCKTHCNGCMDVAWASFWEKARAGNLVFFRVKWLWPAMKGTSCVRRVRLRSKRAQSVPPLCSATSGCSCVTHVCAVLCVCWLSVCRSQCNGCMIVVVLCCHVRREIQVCNLMLQNAL